jgi:nucleotide-binding universal stress UspA family protein
MSASFTQPRIAGILFATDLSENANRALGYAVSLANAYNAGLTVLHVFGKLPPNADLFLAALLGYASIEELRQKSESQLKERIRTRLEEFCGEIAARVPACRLLLRKVIVETGDAKERILHHARTGGYDALVMGSRGHGLIQEVLLGGTFRKVLRDCPIPVFVVPIEGRFLPSEYQHTTGAVDGSNAQ